MKAGILEIVISLFAVHMNKAMRGENFNPNEHSDCYVLAASKPSDVLKAMTWLETLVKKTHEKKYPTQIIQSSIRVYPEPERNKLGEEGIRLLEELVQIKILSLNQREAVIEQIFQLEGDEIPIHHLRWVLFIVLANEAKNLEQLCWLESLVLRDHKTRVIN